MAAAVEVMLVVVVVVEGVSSMQPKGCGRQDGPASGDEEAMRKLGMRSSNLRLGDRSDMMRVVRTVFNDHSEAAILLLRCLLSECCLRRLVSRAGGGLREAGGGRRRREGPIPPHLTHSPPQPRPAPHESRPDR
ncbi:hypothetical protein E2C01_047070 [Portunus trituberculatus]|uniref:Uncharacterized protein n=1 Tax=Portunus trituberculatus TaxID=210409 RepID=A0A5B7G2M7_PORTR|nr:hypothetical protein [Portunus trituberculatus]